MRISLISDTRQLLEQKKTDDVYFFAFRGKRKDSRLENIKKAIDFGVKGVFCESDIYDQVKELCEPAVEVQKVNNARGFYEQLMRETYISKDYYENLKKLGVTGTKGKTSIAYLINLILQDSLYFGTFGVKFGQYAFEERFDHSLTTPKTDLFYKVLGLAEKLRVGCCVTESTSIALDDERIYDEYDLGVFNNFTPDDHLDYHLTAENYLSSKLLLADQSKIILCGKGVYRHLKNRYQMSEKKIYVSGEDENLFKMTYVFCPDGFEIKIYLKEKVMLERKLEILGEFQLDNILFALNACLLLELNKGDLSAEDIIYRFDQLASKEERIRKRLELRAVINGQSMIEEFDFVGLGNEVFKSGLSISARMEVLGAYNGGLIILDFAHTPQSLKLAIQAIKKHDENLRVIVIFGSGGNRDSSKRSVMGKVAGEFADIVIVTDDNPRFENAADIRAQILKECKDGIEAESREKAIEIGMKMLKKNTVLLIAGKGDEEYQIIGDEKIKYSDREVAERFLNQE